MPFLLAKVLLIAAAGGKRITFLRRCELTMLQRIASYLYKWTALIGLFRLCNLKNIEDMKLGGDMERWGNLGRAGERGDRQVCLKYRYVL